ncbi:MULTISPECIES: PIG-L deacetylase family protein [unclassified Nocardia]|uniref:PIG-L deacetylase family protein n=1 Tax=unclassified Nocardia TaxID=2637762 RepID=UPI001CE40426|nr:MULTISPECIES: PIG-L family deacetylase [unclassified Nocardia]
MLESNHSILGLVPGDRALVIAPHPDDETIGPGGTIARLAADRIEVHVLCVTVRSAPMWGGRSDPATRTQEFEKACAALGVTSSAIAWVDDTGELDISNRRRALVDLIERHEVASLAAVRPQALFIPSASGFHQDHQAVHAAAFAAARAQPPGLKPTSHLVLGYRGAEERWSSHNEPWWLHVDTSNYWHAKEEALRAYGTQMRTAGPRSIRQIQLMDAAAGSSLSWEYAESFVPYRIAC